MRSDGSSSRVLVRALLHASAFTLILVPVSGGENPKRNLASDAEDPLLIGRRAFSHRWIEDDSRSHGGDGLGPVFNDSSCVACHDQGGTGGGGPAGKNVDVITAFFGSGRTASAIKPSEMNSVDLSDLNQIHGGFDSAGSVVLHRFGLSPAYKEWRKRLMTPEPSDSTVHTSEADSRSQAGKPEKLPELAKHGKFTIRRTQRNPTALFGAGLIDRISEKAIEAAANAKHAAFPSVQGRVSRTNDGRVGRFGWKAQIASLNDFVLTACAVELGLEVPGHHQAGDPLGYGDRVKGLDLSESECNALVLFVTSLPVPVKTWRTSPGGERLFESLGCAACHLPTLGGVDGLYSDLLLHNMGNELQDTGGYGAFTRRSPGEETQGQLGPVAARDHESAGTTKQPNNRPATGAGRLEWRTPPLWGVGDSAPYLHDGRAQTLNSAILLHGGEAFLSAAKYRELPAVEKLHLLKFLSALRAPPRHDQSRSARHVRSDVTDPAPFLGPPSEVAPF
jgi:CxxC motif-containing protein (DUF1111 family)